MYQGFTASQEQDKARWELMQRRAEQAKQNASAVIGEYKAATVEHGIDRLMWALAMKRQQAVT